MVRYKPLFDTSVSQLIRYGRERRVKFQQEVALLCLFTIVAETAAMSTRIARNTTSEKFLYARHPKWEGDGTPSAV